MIEVRALLLGMFAGGAIVLAGYVTGTLLEAAAGKPASSAYRPELCSFKQDNPFWGAVTYMNNDNAALRLQALRTDGADAHLRGTPADYAVASGNYDVLLGYIAREVYLCGWPETSP